MNIREEGTQVEYLVQVRHVTRPVTVAETLDILRLRCFDLIGARAFTDA